VPLEPPAADATWPWWLPILVVLALFGGVVLWRLLRTPEVPDAPDA
jgi:hypothetical protein